MKFFTGKIFGLLVLLPLLAAAQPDPLFLSQEVLKIEIYADMETVLKDIGENRGWHNALIIYDENGKQLRLDAELKSRGNFRRKAEICSFPPYKVNFKKKQIQGTLFEGCDKIKLVTHCNTEDRQGNENVLTEYLIYRIYNQLTDTSFRVRLCEITWYDILDTYRPVTRYGFFIEKIENLAHRHDLVEIEAQTIKAGQLHASAFRKFSLLQFLIGNTDWSVLLPQNIKMLGKDSSVLVPVPYDFDICQLISPAYAQKTYGFDLENAKPEIKAYCESLNDFEPAIKEYLDNQDIILALVEDFPLLSNKEKTKIVRFLNERFDMLKDREYIEREVFINYCK